MLACKGERPREPYKRRTSARVGWRRAMLVAFGPGRLLPSYSVGVDSPPAAALAASSGVEPIPPSRRAWGISHRNRAGRHVEKEHGNEGNGGSQYRVLRYLGVQTGLHGISPGLVWIETPRSRVQHRHHAPEASSFL